MQQHKFSDPFTEVKAERTYINTGDGQQDIPRTAVMVKDDSGVFRLAGSVSTDYQLIDNRLARDIASDIFTRSEGKGLKWQPLMKAHSGKDEDGRERGKEMVSFNGRRYLHHFVSDPIPELDINGEETGHDIRLGALLRNAYDGSAKFGMEMFMFNYMCENQYYSRNQFGYFAIRHTADARNRFDLEDACQQLSNSVTRAIEIAPRLKAMQRIPITVDSIIEARQKTKFPGRNWGDVLRELDKQQKTRFGLYQAMTHVASKSLHGLNAIDKGTSVTDFMLSLSEN